jgi:hypothetical protein
MDVAVGEEEDVCVVLGRDLEGGVDELPLVPDLDRDPLVADLVLLVLSL